METVRGITFDNNLAFRWGGSRRFAGNNTP